jgi:hypothetical protein
MPNVESKIVVNIRAVVDGLPQVKELSASVNALNKKGSGTLTSDLDKVEKGFLGVGKAGTFAKLAAFDPLAVGGRLLTGLFRSLLMQLNFLIAGFAIFLATLPAIGFGLLIKEGLQWNSVMEQTKIGMTALIQSTQNLFSKDQPNKPLEGLEAFQAASAIAEVAALRLRIKIIPLKATSEELLPIFNQIVVAGATAGLTLNQTEDTFISLASAAQILNVPIERLGTEIRLLLGGVSRETSRLAPALFGTAAAARAFVKEHKAAGDLFPALQTKLVAYNMALVRSESSFATLAQNSKEVFQLLAGLATTGLFEKIKQGLTVIVSTFFDLHAGKLKTEYEALFNFINNALSRIGDFMLGLLMKVVGYLQGIAAYVKDNAQSVSNVLSDLLNISIQLGGILGDVASIVGDTDKARAETADWHTILGYVAITLAICRDAINLIIGAIQVLGGVILIDLLEPLWAAAKFFGMFSQAAEDAATAIQRVQQGALSFSESGIKRMSDAAEGAATNAAVERFLNGGTIGINRNNNPLADSTNMVPKKLSPVVDTKDAERAIKRLIQLVKRTAALQRQLADSAIAGEMAVADQAYELLRQRTETEMSEADRAYKHRLLSIQEFYAEKGRLDDKASEAEKAHLRFNFEEEKKILANKIREIKDEFEGTLTSKGLMGGLLNDPKDSNAAKDQLREQERIKLSLVNNELEKKRVELDTQLLLIDGKRVRTQEELAAALADAQLEFQQLTTSLQADLLAESNQVADADLVRLGQDLRSKFKEVIAEEAGISSEAIKSIIGDLDSFGSVSAQTVRDILTQEGVRFEDLSASARGLITLFELLQNKTKAASVDRSVGVINTFTDARKADIQDRVSRGVLTEVQGRQAIALAEQRANIDLERQLELMIDLLPLTEAQKNSLEGLDMTSFINQLSTMKGLTQEQISALLALKQQLNQAGREADALGNAINSTIVNDLGSFFNTIIDGNQSLADSFRQLFSGLLLDIAKLIMQMYIMKAISALLGLTGIGTGGAGSASGIGGTISHLGGGHLAEGGEARGPGTSKSDSILSWLSNGEWVIPAQRVAQYGRGFMRSLTDGTFGRSFMRLAAGGPVGASRADSNAFSVGLRNVNLFDPELLAEHMNNAHGERVLLNIISKNPTKVRQLLGL